MSHITKVNVEVNSLDALSAAVQRLGGTLNEGQTNFRAYGSRNACDHAINFGDQTWEIGVTEGEDGQYELKWDSWGGGHGLTDIVGRNCENLKKFYTAERSKIEARKQGYSVQEYQTEDDGIKLVIDVDD